VLKEGAAVSLPGEAVSAAAAESMEAFVSRVLPEAYRLAADMLRDPIEAEDIAHDAVVAAWERRASLRDRALICLAGSRYTGASPGELSFRGAACDETSGISVCRSGGGRAHGGPVVVDGGAVGARGGC
jgi:hypothetical protein